jgi:hypothetical protein
MERRESARGLARPPLGEVASPARAPCEGARPPVEAGCALPALHPSNLRGLRKLDCSARVVGAPAVLFVEMPLEMTSDADQGAGMIRAL